MKAIKPLYSYLLIADAGIYFALVVLIIIYRPSDWITVSAQLAGAFAAIATAIIAVSIADKPPKFVKFKFNMEVNKDNIETYDQDGLSSIGASSEDIKALIDLGMTPISKSYQVFFNITNTSGFSLRKPVLTFELPKKLQHPHKLDKGKWISYFRSNLYNVPYVQLLESGDRIVLSNNILPYFSNEQDLEIWIRMCLSEDDKSRYPLRVSLNCDNAEGQTLTTKITPKKLLEEIGEIK